MLDTILTYPVQNPSKVFGFYEIRPRFIAVLDEEGHFLGWQSNENTVSLPTLGGNGRGSSYVPYLFDHAEYMFGMPAGDTRAAKRHALYTGLWAEVVKVDAALEPVVKFLANAEEKQKAFAALVANPGQGSILYRVEREDGRSEFLHERESLKPFWANILQAERAKKSGKTPRQCMVCLKPNQIVATSHITTLTASGAASFQSHGWEGSLNAPVCWPCIDRYTEHWRELENARFSARFKLSRSRSKEGPHSVFWGFSQPTEEEDSQSIYDLPLYLERLRSGNGPGAAPEGERFRGVIWHTVKSRYVIHRVYDENLNEVIDCVSEWFASMYDTSLDGYKVKYPATISKLVRAILPIGLSPEVKTKLVNPLMEDHLLDAAFFGKPLPPYILTSLLKRYQSTPVEILRGPENKATDSKDELFARPYAAEYALLNLALHYTAPGVKKMPVPSKIDTNFDNPSYLAGRLFRCMERMQYLALGNVNSGVVSKYFASFTHRPFYTIKQMEAMYQKHFEKALRNPEKAGQAVTLHTIVCSIQAQRPAEEDKDPRGNLYENGLAIRGYYHQDAQFRFKTFKKGASADSVEEKPDAADRAAYSVQGLADDDDAEDVDVQD